MQTQRQRVGVRGKGKGEVYKNRIVKEMMRNSREEIQKNEYL